MHKHISCTTVPVQLQLVRNDIAPQLHTVLTYALHVSSVILCDRDPIPLRLLRFGTRATRELHNCLNNLNTPAELQKRQEYIREEEGGLQKYKLYMHTRMLSLIHI